MAGELIGLIVGAHWCFALQPYARAAGGARGLPFERLAIYIADRPADDEKPILLLWASATALARWSTTPKERRFSPIHA
jgi:hypothetical protein